MPVDFLSSQQAARYGQYHQEPDAAQLARFFHLDDTDRTHIARYRRAHTRLSFALQLCSVRFLGTFLPDLTRVPPRAAQYVADQIQIADPAAALVLRGRSNPHTHYEQTRRIMAFYGYREFARAGFALTRCWNPWSNRDIRRSRATDWSG
jgi:TnpA family transposase